MTPARPRPLATASRKSGAAIERTFLALPVDDAVARRYGQLAAAAAGSGRQPRARVMHLLIAATAATHGARLYTRNADDLIGLGSFVEIITVS